MDVFVIILALPFALPVLLVLSALVYLTMGAPVFYCHRRLGQGGKVFVMWKFRSMVRDADQVLEEVLANDPDLRAEWEEKYKLMNDPRVTPLGRVLRKYSLDELPQLWNVLRGDMSLVGPRPITEAEVGYYKEDIQYFYQVLPGITGAWQVSGRSDLTYPERVQLDKNYVLQMSFWQDLRIFLKTFLVVVRRTGAF